MHITRSIIPFLARYCWRESYFKQYFTMRSYELNNAGFTGFVEQNAWLFFFNTYFSILKIHSIFYWIAFIKAIRYYAKPMSKFKLCNSLNYSIFGKHLVGGNHKISALIALLKFRGQSCPTHIRSISSNRKHRIVARYVGWICEQ